MAKTFEQWLQERLIAHGFPVRRDGGVKGGEVNGALFDFQRHYGLELTGVADASTVAQLRKRPMNDGGAFEAVAVPEETMPPWMAEMYRRMGLHERRDNAVLTAWLKAGRFLGNPAELPWCGDAVETCIVKTLPREPVPNNPFFAQNWKTFGRAVDASPAGAAVVGAIGVIRWSASAGHVGIVAGADGNRVTVIGGNQSDAITVASFPRSKFIAFRWPKTFPYKTYAPVDAATAAGGGMAATR